MPFYFALPRTGFTSNQGRQTTGRVDYVRTSPTSLTFTTSVSKTRDQCSLPDFLHGVAMSAIAGKKSGTFDKAFIIDGPSRFLFNQVDPHHLIKITLPKMSFRFKDLSESQMDRLDELNLEDRNVKGKGKVWVGSVTAQQAIEVIGYGVQENYAAMGGTISVRGIRAINDIIRIITMSAQTLSLVNDRGANPVKVIEYGNTYSNTKLMKYSVSTMSDKTTKTDKEKGFNVRDYASDTVVFSTQPLPSVTGNIDDLSGMVSHGIFCPFEPNFSQTDRRAIHLLLSEFSCLCTDPESFDVFDEDYVDVWTKELCLTMEGEFLAHMISSLSLARKIGARICFLITGNLYEGAVLHGSKEFSFKLVGGATHKSLETGDLRADIEGYAFHSTTLKSLLEEIGIGEDVVQSNIKTMRQLRSIIMGKSGHALTPDIEAKVARKLVFLNFREKPESVNPSSLGKFFSYIHPSSPAVVPETMYLDRRAFFSKDPIMLALSMFGMYAPSPIITGQTFLLAVASNSTKKPSNEPASLQFCNKELSVSAKDWEGFIRGGAIVQPTQKIRRGRRFAGADKTEIWGHLTTIAAAGVNAKRNDADVQKVDRAAEKRARDGSDAVERKEKALRSVDFSAFEDMSGGMVE